MSITDLSPRPDALQRVLQSLGPAAEDEAVRATAPAGGVASGICRVRSAAAAGGCGCVLAGAGALGRTPS